MSFSFSSFVASNAAKRAATSNRKPTALGGKQRLGASKDKKKSAGWTSGFGRSPAKRSAGPAAAGPVKLAATRAARSARSAAGGARNVVSSLLNRLRGR